MLCKDFLTIEGILEANEEMSIEEAEKIVNEFNRKVKAKHEQQRQKIQQWKNNRRRSQEIL